MSDLAMAIRSALSMVAIISRRVAVGRPTSKSARMACFASLVRALVRAPFGGVVSGASAWVTTGGPLLDTQEVTGSSPVRPSAASIPKILLIYWSVRLFFLPPPLAVQVQYGPVDAARRRSHPFLLSRILQHKYRAKRTCRPAVFHVLRVLADWLCSRFCPPCAPDFAPPQK